MVDPAPLDADDGPTLRRAALERELEALYGSHYARVVGYFRRMGQAEAQAHELAQDSYVLALRGLAGFRGEAKLSTWLWTIAHNVLKAHLRKREAVALSSEDHDLDVEALMLGEDAHLNPQVDCIRRGFARFAALHPERAQALYLAEVEDYSSQELAAVIGRTPRATEQYLSQSRAKLRPFIENCCEP